MSSINNSYAFLADYNSVINCLYSIEQQDIAGVFSDNTALQVRLRTFENDVLRKLYNTSIRVLVNIAGYSEGFIPGDFEDEDYSSIDFSTGTPTNVNMLGDFARTDFLTADFWTGNQGNIATGYTARLQAIVEMFGVFGNHLTEISDADKYALDVALVQFLDAFDDLKSYLGQQGLNPCTESPYQNNSPGLYLQAAGADGSDGVAEGIHLRWSMAGDLADKHLPQGDYVSSGAVTTGYNQPDDFVKLYRTPYAGTVRNVLDFERSVPVIDYPSKRWTYSTSVTAGGKTFVNRVSLTFVDAVAYNQIASNVNPQINSFEFLKQYDSLLEIAVSNKTSFAVEFDLREKEAGDSSVLKIDVLSTSADGETLNIRQTVTTDPGSQVNKTILGDNISRIKLKKSSGGYLQSFSFETYDEFLATRNTVDWTIVGEAFGLALSDQVAFERLETSSYPIDNLWPQYNEGTRVKVANYQDKWGVSRVNDPSIKDTVAQYLILSQTDPRATGTIKDENAGPEAPEMSVSYLDVLNLMATDFHVARMLGLGHIDTPVVGSLGERFIYKIVYTGRKSAGSTDTATYQYLSLPTAKSDARQPERPVIRPVTYNLPGSDGSNKAMFDADGYAATDDVRLVNIGRAAFDYEKAGDENFADLSLVENFNNYENTKAIFYGIEYRPESQEAFVKPEITNGKGTGHLYYAYDNGYAEGVLESVPVPDNLTSLYVHLEREQGVHNYAIYGINWFSRASLTSGEAATSPTIFPVKNTLLPPADIAVQYIQKEDTLLFTTQTEQDWLSGRNVAFPGQDTSFSRVCFNWLDITDISHLQTTGTLDNDVVKADRVNTYFKPGEPLELTGSIKSISPFAGTDNLLALQTGTYQLLDGTVVTPAVDAADYSRFIGSQLTTSTGKFNVTDLTEGTDGPVITVEKIKETDTVERLEEPGRYATYDSFITPETGSRFSLVENLANAENWETVTASVSLADFGSGTNPEIETNTDEEGNVTRYLIGGITGEAVVSSLDTDGDGQPDLPGYYRVSFPGVNLGPHPQNSLPFNPDDPGSNPPAGLNEPYVEWYKGLVRVPVSNSNEKKLLEVVRIAQTSPLVVYAADPNYQDSEIQLSADESDLVSGINFHPGYKAYFFAEPAPDHTFNSDSILPEAGQNSKKTLIGLQSTIESGAGSGFSSRISVPAVLLARRIEEPVQMEAPVAYGLKVRPDATGKAAFTMDIKVAPGADGLARDPFGFTFYRTNQEEVLYALYQAGTVAAILNDLDALTEDLYYNERFLELVNLTFDFATPGQFKLFDAAPSPYGFPLPDKEGLYLPTDSEQVKMEKYRLAIWRTLLPLSEQTPVFSFIKTGFQTENKKPKIRTLDGQLLDPSQPDFDPFPMIRKFTKDEETNTTYVRFTDYTLNAASRNLYFYACAETTNTLTIGPLSAFTGPVSVLHTSPAETPVIRSYSIGTAAELEDGPIAITFKVSPFSPADNISKIRVYRSLDQAKTVSLQAMMAPFEIDLIGQDLSAGLEVNDNFSDLVTAPIGETVYYRIAAVRTIINELEQQEDVSSPGSSPIAIRLIDTINPDAPDISYDPATNALSWLPTVNKGVYYLYKQNQRGNWEKLSTIMPVDTSVPTAYTLPAPLTLQDEDGNRVYNRFKVKVENSSGLLNLVDKELTI